MILFRVDSSFTLGTGHVLRCLHLAKLLKSLGHSIEFLCKDLPGNIMSQISSQGFPVHPLPEKSDGLRTITDLKPAWIIIDHYEIGKAWQEQLPASTRIFVIDDLMNRDHYCHVLLDQNYRRQFSAYKKLIPQEALLLTGPQYCLLPQSLQKPIEHKRPSQAPKILSFFGGSDSTGELLKLAEALIEQNFKFETSFIALESHKHLERLRSLKMPSHFSLIQDPANWHQLIEQSDFYVGSGGTVTWERLFLGLPGAVIAVAENQEIPSKELSEDGYQFYFGPRQNFDYSTASKQISSALADASVLKTMSQKGLELVGKFDSALAQKIFN